MNTKNRIIMIILAAVMTIVAVIGVRLKSNENKASGDVLSGKTLVVYFSAQNHTKNLAEGIAKKLDADIFKIVPQEKYTNDDLNYNDKNSRVFKEHDDDEAKRHILLEKVVPDNFDSYENVIIAYPIWWGIAAYPVSSFVMGNTFDNKNIYPVCTSASSGLGDSAKNLKSISSGGTWHEGYRFSEDATSSDIDIWLKTISK